MGFDIIETQVVRGAGSESFVRALATLIDAQGEECRTDIKLDKNGIRLKEQGKSQSYQLTWAEIIEMALNAAGRSQVAPPSVDHIKRFNKYFAPLRNKMQGTLFDENG